MHAKHTKHDINDIMTVKEAVDRWQISRHTLRDILAGKSPRKQAQINEALEIGEAKRYKGSTVKYEWLLTTKVMTEWFGDEPVKK